MGQRNAHIDPVHIAGQTLTDAIDMDGIILMGEIPRLAVDAGGGQTGRLQTDIGLVGNLCQSFSFELCDGTAVRILFGITEC